MEGSPSSKMKLFEVRNMRLKSQQLDLEPNFSKKSMIGLTILNVEASMALSKSKGEELSYTCIEDLDKIQTPKSFQIPIQIPRRQTINDIKAFIGGKNADLRLNFSPKLNDLKYEGLSDISSNSHDALSWNLGFVSVLKTIKSDMALITLNSEQFFNLMKMANNKWNDLTNSVVDEKKNLKQVEICFDIELHFDLINLTPLNSPIFFSRQTLNHKGNVRTYEMILMSSLRNEEDFPLWFPHIPLTCYSFQEQAPPHFDITVRVPIGFNVVAPAKLLEKKIDEKLIIYRFSTFGSQLGLRATQVGILVAELEENEEEKIIFSKNTDLEDSISLRILCLEGYKKYLNLTTSHIKKCIESFQTALKHAPFPFQSITILFLPWLDECSYRDTSGVCVPYVNPADGVISFLSLPNDNGVWDTDGTAANLQRVFGSEPPENKNLAKRVPEAVLIGSSSPNESFIDCMPGASLLSRFTINQPYAPLLVFDLSLLRSCKQSDFSLGESDTNARTIISRSIAATYFGGTHFFERYCSVKPDRGRSNLWLYFGLREWLLSHYFRDDFGIVQEEAYMYEAIQWYCVQVERGSDDTPLSLVPPPPCLSIKNQENNKEKVVSCTEESIILSRLTCSEVFQLKSMLVLRVLFHSLSQSTFLPKDFINTRVSAYVKDFRTKNKFMSAAKFIAKIVSLVYKHYASHWNSQPQNRTPEKQLNLLEGHRSKLRILFRQGLHKPLSDLLDDIRNTWISYVNSLGCPQLVCAMLMHLQRKGTSTDSLVFHVRQVPLEPPLALENRIGKSLSSRAGWAGLLILNQFLAFLTCLPRRNLMTPPSISSLANLIDSAARLNPINCREPTAQSSWISGFWGTYMNAGLQNISSKTLMIKSILKDCNSCLSQLYRKGICICEYYKNFSYLETERNLLYRRLLGNLKNTEKPLFYNDNVSTKTDNCHILSEQIQNILQTFIEKKDISDSILQGILGFFSLFYIIRFSWYDTEKYGPEMLKNDLGYLWISLHQSINISEDKNDISSIFPYLCHQGLLSSFNKLILSTYLNEIEKTRVKAAHLLNVPQALYDPVDLVARDGNFLMGFGYVGRKKLKLSAGHGPLLRAIKVSLREGFVSSSLEAPEKLDELETLIADTVVDSSLDSQDGHRSWQTPYSSTGGLSYTYLIETQYQNIKKYLVSLSLEDRFFIWPEKRPFVSPTTNIPTTQIEPHLTDSAGKNKFWRITYNFHIVEDDGIREEEEDGRTGFNSLSFNVDPRAERGRKKVALKPGSSITANAVLKMLDSESNEKANPFLASERSLFNGIKSPADDYLMQMLMRCVIVKAPGAYRALDTRSLVARVCAKKCLPVLWIRTNHGLHWLARERRCQSIAMWEQQLMNDPNAAAQLEAGVALAYVPHVLGDAQPDEYRRCPDSRFEALDTNQFSSSRRGGAVSQGTVYAAFEKFIHLHRVHPYVRGRIAYAAALYCVRTGSASLKNALDFFCGYLKEYYLGGNQTKKRKNIQAFSNSSNTTSEIEPGLLIPSTSAENTIITELPCEVFTIPLDSCPPPEKRFLTHLLRAFSILRDDKGSTPLTVINIFLQLLKGRNTSENRQSDCPLSETIFGAILADCISNFKLPLTNGDELFVRRSAWVPGDSLSNMPFDYLQPHYIDTVVTGCFEEKEKIENIQLLPLLPFIPCVSTDIFGDEKRDLYTDSWKMALQDSINFRLFNTLWSFFRLDKIIEMQSHNSVLTSAFIRVMSMQPLLRYYAREQCSLRLGGPFDPLFFLPLQYEETSAEKFKRCQNLFKALYTCETGVILEALRMILRACCTGELVIYLFSSKDEYFSPIRLGSVGSYENTINLIKKQKKICENIFMISRWTILAEQNNIVFNGYGIQTAIEFCIYLRKKLEKISLNTENNTNYKMLIYGRIFDIFYDTLMELEIQVPLIFIPFIQSSYVEGTMDPESYNEALNSQNMFESQICPHKDEPTLSCCELLWALTNSTPLSECSRARIVDIYKFFFGIGAPEIAILTGKAKPIHQDMISKYLEQAAQGLETQRVSQFKLKCLKNSFGPGVDTEQWTEPALEMTRALRDLPQAAHFIKDPAADKLFNAASSGCTAEPMWFNLIEARLRSGWYPKNRKRLMDFKSDVHKIFRYCREVHKNKPADYQLLKDCTTVETTFNDLWGFTVQMLHRKRARLSADKGTTDGAGDRSVHETLDTKNNF